MSEGRPRPTIGAGSGVSDPNKGKDKDTEDKKDDEKKELI